jgi:hypothetical protein
MPQIELIDTVADARERALGAFRTGTSRTIEGAGVLPERVLVAWLRRVKEQARRSDVVGTAARGLLEAVHTPAGGAASFFTTIERESSLPRRSPRRKAASSRPSGRAAAERTGTTGTGSGRSGAARRGAKRTGARRSGARPAAAPAAVQRTAPEEVLPIVVG